MGNKFSKKTLKKEKENLEMDNNKKKLGKQLSKIRRIPIDTDHFDNHIKLTLETHEIVEIENTYSLVRKEINSRIWQN